MPPAPNGASAFPVSIKGVILDRGRVLLLRNARAEWELPGGRLEPGEAPEDCLAREIAEELGLAARIGPILDCWVYPVLPLRSVVIVTYGASVAGLDGLRHGDEHDALVAAPIDSIDGLAMPEGYRASIRRWAARAGDLARGGG